VEVPVLGLGGVECHSAFTEGIWVKYLATYSLTNIPLETHPLDDFINHF
jgi:hypothetical protein